MKYSNYFIDTDRIVALTDLLRNAIDAAAENKKVNQHVRMEGTYTTALLHNACLFVSNELKKAL